MTNLLLCQTWTYITHKKSIKIFSKSNKLKWNDRFKQNDESYSMTDVYDYFEFIITNLKQLLLIFRYKYI